MLEFKRQLKSARANFTNEVPIHEYPPDPRQLPETLRKQFYTDEVWGQMPAAVLARCKPGKWLRLSSKELTRAGPSQAQQPDMMGGIQQMMQMQMHMFQAMMHGKQPNQDLLDNFQVFPQKRRKSLESGSIANQQGCNQLALQDGNVRNHDDVDQEPAPINQGRRASDQKQQLNNVPAFSLPDFKGEEKNTEDPQKHHEAMLLAFEERKAAREADPPKAKAKAKAKGKAKAKAKSMAKPAAAVKASKPKAKAKPAMIVKGALRAITGWEKSIVPTPPSAGVSFEIRETA